MSPERTEGGIWAIPDPEEHLRAALRAFKDHARFAVRGPLASAWCRAARAAGAGASDAVVLLVPSRTSSLARRGFDPVRALSRGVPVLPAAAAWVSRPMRDQRGLSAAQRQRNVRGGFSVDPAWVSGRSVILADDVATTGSTLGALASAVSEAGGRTVGMAALISVHRSQTR